MLKLSASQQAGPYWLDLIQGVRIRVKPVTVAAIIAARHAAAEAMKTQGADVAVGSVAFTCSLARWGIADWEGVGDAEGDAVYATSENIDVLLEVWQAFDAIDRLYVMPALIGAQEKNA